MINIYIYSIFKIIDAIKCKMHLNVIGANFNDFSGLLHQLSILLGS